MGKNLMVIFPGIGYHSDKPLLYYAKKIAMQNDFEIKEVDFEGLSKDAIENRKMMIEAFGVAVQQAESQLKDVDFDSYDKVIFTSKSIGTVAASVVAAKRKVPAKQVYFTPLEQTFSLVEEKNGLVFMGLDDPLVDTQKIKELCAEKHLILRVFEGANHSLETGEVRNDLHNMVRVIEETENYLVGSPIYKFTVLGRDGEKIGLSEFKDKVLLIVNSATGCGFTPQYEALENMYRIHKNDGFEILDFPCNQFANQAPGSNDEIHRFCQSRYDITFPQFAKIEVNGENEMELYTYLKSRQGFRGFLRNSKESIYLEKIVKEIDPDYQTNSSIKWNFTKFLVNKQGQVIDRFEPDAGTEIVVQAVERALRES